MELARSWIEHKNFKNVARVSCDEASSFHTFGISYLMWTSV